MKYQLRYQSIRSGPCPRSGSHGIVVSRTWPAPADFLLLLMFLLPFSLISCAHFSVNSTYGGPETIPDTVTSEYAYRPYTGKCDEKLIADRGGYLLKKITFLSNNKTVMGDTIELEYYDIKGSEKTPVIIVLPMLRGGGKVLKAFSEYYAKKGYASIIVNRKKRYLNQENIIHIGDILKEILANHRQVIDWIECQEDLDSKRIGLLGISFGAINGALLCQLDNRIRASVIALGSGDLPYVLTYSKEKSVKAMRNIYTGRNHMTRQDFQHELKQRVTCDPINYATYMDAQTSMMILAIFDQCVPFCMGKKLQKKTGKPETIYLFSGHYTSVFYKPYIERVTYKFFKEKF